MKEKPILFSTPMVQAILEGSKTMTRRVVRELKNYLPETWERAVPHNMYDTPYLKIPYQEFNDVIGGRYLCPHGEVGDRLWVRETWFADKKYNLLKPSEIPILSPIGYTSIGVKPNWAGKTRTARFMCKWMSHIALENTNIRVERLQEIMTEDIEKEGIDGWCTVQFNAFLAGKITTQRMGGGNTKEFYKQDGTLNKSNMLEQLHPDVAKVVWKFNRWHHHVDYSIFKNNKLIKRDGVVVNGNVDEYGMMLVKIK